VPHHLVAGGPHSRKADKVVDTYRTDEAAELAGISRRLVLKHIHTHNLGRKFGTLWTVTRAEVEFMKRRKGLLGHAGWLDPEATLIKVRKGLARRRRKR
jgi:hypothetical protein